MSNGLVSICIKNVLLARRRLFQPSEFGHAFNVMCVWGVVGGGVGVCGVCGVCVCVCGGGGGGGGGVWTPYPRGSTTIPPPNFFLPTSPLLFHIFFRVPPPQIQSFCTPPIWPSPRTIFRLKPPYPRSTTTTPLPLSSPHQLSFLSYRYIFKLIDCKFTTLITSKTSVKWTPLWMC